MLSQYCPNCNASNNEGWYFSYSYCDEDGMQIEPAYGQCSHCGFKYEQHCKHPLTEQLEKFRKREKEMVE